MARLRELLPGLQRCKAYVTHAGADSFPVAVSAMGEQLDKMEHLELHLGEGCQITQERSLDFTHLG
jgi:hypothetical protein